MANRYLVATGNWNSTSVWSTTSGGAPGASVPGTSDVAIIDRNFRVTLTADASVLEINQSIGTVDLDANILSVRIYTLSGTGVLQTNQGIVRIATIGSSGGVRFNMTSTSAQILGDGYFFHDITVNAHSHILPPSYNQTQHIQIEKTTTTGVNIAITNATYNSIISHKKSLTGAFTISFVGGTTTNIRKFVVKSDGNPTNIQSSSQFTLNAIGSNQIWAINNVTVRDLVFSGLGTLYVGSDSVDNGNNSNVIFDDAPLIETLQDEFNGSTLNSSRWNQTTSSGGGVTVTGGELVLSGTNSSSVATVRAVNQFEYDGSKISGKFIFTSFGGSTQAEVVFTDALFQYGVSPTRQITKLSMTFIGTDVTFVFDSGLFFETRVIPVTGSTLYWQLEPIGQDIIIRTSADGFTYTDVETLFADAIETDLSQLIARPSFTVRGNATLTVDNFNIDLTPTANFSATPLTLNRGSSVQFTDLSNFSPNTWSWNFGDSTTSTQQNPLKTYSLPGTYTVALTASDGVNSDSETKNNYITVNSVTASRSAGGTLSLSGGVSANKTAIRSAGGTLMLSGNVFAIRGLNASAIERKTYMWKVYDEDNNYVGVLDDVITEPTWTEEINSDGSSMEIELARNSDSLVVGTEPLQDSDDLDILDSNNFQILTTTQSRNKVGPGSNIAHNYRVDLFVFYGEVSPILDSDSAPILDNNGETIDGTVGAPNGVRRFTGFISQINIRYGDTETTLVQLTSYGYDLDQYLVKSGSNTTVAFNSFDPSDIVKDGLDAFTTQAGGDSFTTYSDQTVATTGTLVSYTFRANTYSELLQKSLELAPPNWYYYVDLGSNLVYFQEKASTARHQFILGRHINKLDLKSYIGSVVNEVLFTGGGDPALYKLYTRSVQSGTRRSLARLSDNRVTVEDSADIIANTELDNKENVQYRSTVTILDRVYDIESIRLGDTVSFRNFDSFVDTIILQVVGKRYTPDFVELQLDTIPLDINKRIEDITRNLNTQETITVPNAPTT